MCIVINRNKVPHKIKKTSIFSDFFMPNNPADFFNLVSISLSVISTGLLVISADLSVKLVSAVHKFKNQNLTDIYNFHDIRPRVYQYCDP
jgi:hypothetical protein